MSAWWALSVALGLAFVSSGVVLWFGGALHDARVRHEARMWAERQEELERLVADEWACVDLDVVIGELHAVLAGLSA